ncbi:hypothetical protein ABZW18_00380 [Streptomyces sp. NPDC004647]|uniref:hypothetical protein n=1 Tax=Streptomyces sp. NPDC004647 TaxID=3154671 RepID=UPI0033B3844B
MSARHVLSTSLQLVAVCWIIVMAPTLFIIVKSRGGVSIEMLGVLAMIAVGFAALVFARRLATGRWRRQ